MSREIVSQLAAIRDQLDAANELVSAAHLQMAIDRLAASRVMRGAVTAHG